ncbi:MAG: hypothetical protein HeimC2_25330 [Candidatus Heimdallarchaeota archaeon LC_2]|nr:MAG: hypothetical protein HeimC2_25330 [Candidatus Heimdallarchaeota archaeon LC_2]
MSVSGGEIYFYVDVSPSEYVSEKLIDDVELNFVGIYCKHFEIFDGLSQAKRTKKPSKYKAKYIAKRIEAAERLIQSGEAFRFRKKKTRREYYELGRDLLEQAIQHSSPFIQKSVNKNKYTLIQNIQNSSIVYEIREDYASSLFAYADVILTAISQFCENHKSNMETMIGKIDKVYFIIDELPAENDPNTEEKYNSFKTILTILSQASDGQKLVYTTSCGKTQIGIKKIESKEERGAVVVDNYVYLESKS